MIEKCQVAHLTGNIIYMKYIILAFCTAILGANICPALSEDRVKAWEEPIIIPTYLLNPPEKAPIFDCDWSYQRARRSVYPYRFNDNVTRTKKNLTYKALYLENKYLKLCILPEIGGRLFYALDKTNNYDIFYRQDVIKPANVGMAGAWISGGVEWNAFHHHRITSNAPVNYAITENTDGSKTIWVGETELRHRMSWAIGVTLHPGKSYIEISGRLSNSTMDSNSMLYWTNAATHVDENYQIIFPQNTEFGTFHCKSSFCHWPITREAYTGVDEYKYKLDASWWKNHPSSNSIFVYDLKDDFIAGYDYGRNAGTIAVGNHHIVKGGKFWLWGQNSGWATKILTDTAGHYIELMSGAYSDNQPDYTWIYPYELKKFSQYWYGLRDIGGVKKASKQAAINMDLLKDGKVLIAALTTEELNGLELSLWLKDKRIFCKKIDTTPASPFVEILEIGKNISEGDLMLTLKSPEGKTMLSYTPVLKDANKALPDIVRPPKTPEEIANNEECYFVGLRNLQFHNPFINPTDYFMEVLRRDPKDTRANTQMGIYFRKRGELQKAKKYLMAALERQTKDYTRPQDCEATYNLGLVLKAEGKYEAATEMLYRAAWNYAYNSAANFQIAQIYSQNGDYESALERLDEALIYNGANLHALNLKCSILRKLGKAEMASECADKALSYDPINTYARHEKNLLKSDTSFIKLMRDDSESYLELALCYLANGFYSEAESLLRYADSKSDYPTIKMHLANLAKKRGDEESYKNLFGQALSMPQDSCNPFRLETISIMEKALKEFPKSDKLLYWLGCACYDKRPEYAMAQWRKCVEIKPENSMAWRNLGYGNWKHLRNYAKADKYYRKAIEIDNTQAIFFEELDQVLELKRESVKTRYDILKKNHEVCKKRYYPLAAEVITGTFEGDYNYVLKLLRECYFPTREGVSDFHDVYLDAVILAGFEKFKKGDFRAAISLYNDAFKFPANHQVFLYDTRIPRDAQSYCMIGDAYEALGDIEKAKLNWQKAAEVNVRNTNWRYYKATALKKLGKSSEAEKIFKALLKDGENGIVSKHVNFYGAEGSTGESVSDINSKMYLTKGLGELGLGLLDEAKKSFEESLRLKPNSLWAAVMLKNHN